MSTYRPQRQVRLSDGRTGVSNDPDGGKDGSVSVRLRNPKSGNLNKTAKLFPANKVEFLD